MSHSEGFDTWNPEYGVDEFFVTIVLYWELWLVAAFVLISARIDVWNAGVVNKTWEESFVARSLTAMSTVLPASTDHELFTTLPQENSTNLNRRLDYISVAIICGVIVLCFIICFIIGCRRNKRHRPPRCQDVSTPTMEPSRSGTVYIILIHQPQCGFTLCHTGLTHHF